MRLEQFNEGLDRWGSDLANWPEAKARMARQLLAHSPEAARALEQAVQFDQLFRLPLPATLDSATMIARITATSQVERPRARPARVGLASWFGFNWAHGVGLAACLAVGLIVGNNVREESGQTVVLTSVSLLDIVDASHVAQSDD